MTDFDRLAEKVRNWGRWGAKDQRGTLNHITPEVLKGAAASVTQGKLFNLGLRFDRDGPQIDGKRFNPKLYMLEMFGAVSPKNADVTYSDDVIHMPLQSATQWDAFAHVHYKGQLYNGFELHDTLRVEGARHCGIEHLASPGILSRGVLLDVARLKGVAILPADTAIGVDDLRAAADRQNVEMRAGDIILVRTGHIRRFTLERDRAAFNGPQAGLAMECAEWIYERAIAAVCADNLAVEVLRPTLMEEDLPIPFHVLALREMGCPLGEMFDLEALAEDCARDGRYSFLFSAPPLAVTGGVGSPVNPLVLK